MGFREELLEIARKKATKDTDIFPIFVQLLLERHRRGESTPLRRRACYRFDIDSESKQSVVRRSHKSPCVRVLFLHIIFVWC